MRSFARLDGSRVVERLDADELPPFHASLIWVECDSAVAVGWLNVGGELVAPTALIEEPIELAAAGRAWRDGAIESVKWMRERHRDEVDLGLGTRLSAVQFRELLEYLQSLRDWPLSDGFPAPESRPEPPLWIAEQTQ